MGLLAARFAFEGRVPTPEDIRARLAESDVDAELRLQPAGAHLVVDGLNVVVVRRDPELELRLRGLLARASGGRVGRTAVVRSALLALGGEELAPANSALHFRFVSPTPSFEQIAHTIGRLRRRAPPPIHPFAATIELVSRSRGEVTLRFDPTSIAVEAALSDRLFEQVVESLKILGGTRRP